MDVFVDLRPAIADRPAALLVSVEQAGKLLGIGRSNTYQPMASGELQSVKVGRRRLIVRDGLDAFVRWLIGEEVYF